MATIESDISHMLNQPFDASPAYVEAYDAPPPDDFPVDESEEGQKARLEKIQANFIAAIEKGQTDMIQLLIDSGQATVNPEFGRQPLAVAAATGQVTLARLFITKYGAEVNRFSDEGFDELGRHIFRTPLMCAAARGSLPIVKMLMEEFGADDSAIAPDGMHALRLAVLKGEDAAPVVEYLPVRRGGGWLRFKHDHFKAMRRIKRGTRGLVWIGKALFWYIPKFFLWDAPRWVVKKLGKAGKWFFTEVLPGAIKALGQGLVKGSIKLSNGFKSLVKMMWDFIKSIPNRTVKLAVFLTKTTPKYIWHLCKTAAVKLVGGTKHFFSVALPHALSVSWAACVKGTVLLKDAIIAGAKTLRHFFFVQVPSATVATSKFIWRLFTVHIPKFIVRLSKFILRVIKALARWTKIAVLRIPGLLKSLGELIAKGAKRTWETLGKGVMLIVSSIHTFIFWIVSRFGQVSFRDVMRSFGGVIKYIFTDLPGLIFEGIENGVKWTGKAIKKLFGWVGEVFVFLFKCLVVAVLYIPVKIGMLIVEFFAWIGRGFREILVWINPKSGF